MVTGQWDKTYGKYQACGDIIVTVFFDDHELLGHEAAADRDHHTAARLQLRNQGRRDVIGCGGNDDGIKGRMRLPALVAVTDSSFNILIAQFV